MGKIFHRHPLPGDKGSKKSDSGQWAFDEYHETLGGIGPGPACKRFSCSYAAIRSLNYARRARQDRARLVGFFLWGSCVPGAAGQLRRAPDRPANTAQLR